MKVTQSCPSLCDLMGYTVHGILQGRILEREPFPSPGDLPNPGMEPRSPTLQVDSLPAETQGMPLIYIVIIRKNEIFIEKWPWVLWIWWAQVPMKHPHGYCLKWKWKWSRSVMSNSLRPHGLRPTRLLHPWDFTGKGTGVGCHFLLQGIFPTQESNPGLPYCNRRYTLWAPRKPEYCLNCSSIYGSELEIVGVLYIIFPRDRYRDDGWSCLLGWDIKQNVRRWTWGMITSGYKQEQKEQAEICEKLLSWEDTQDSNFQGNF